MSIEELESSYHGSPAAFDRTPPQDLNAEMSVLGGMLISKDAIADVVETIRGNDFYRPSHETVYEAIVDLYGRGEPADAITVADELRRRGELERIGGAAFLADLIACVPTAANAGYYARIVRERAVLRRLVEAGTRIVQLGYARDGGDVDDIVNNAQAEIYAVTERRSAEDYLPLADIISGTMDEIETAGHRGEGMTGVPTGFADLDRLTNGLHGGQMIVIAARPAIGKSTLAIDIARSASIKHGQTSVVFSLEMGRNEITMRLLAAEARVQLQKLRTGTLDDTDWQKLAKVMGTVSDAPLFIDDSPNMSLMEIRAKARRLKQRHDLRLIIIDYLQLMSSGKRVESRQQEVSEFSRALKLLAKELEVPVVALSQLNRGPEQRGDRKPQMSDLRESGCLTEDTRILRADTGAETTMGELFALNAKDVPVWALDERLQYVRRHLTHVFPTGVKPVFRLRLASGKQIEATANHPFLSYEGWTPLEELEAGSRIGVPRHVPGPEQNAEWDDRKVIMLAHLLGQGTRANRKPVAHWLDDLGLYGARSHETFVPAGVFHLPKRQIALFLSHIWAAGGFVTIDPGRRSGRIVYRSESRQLADGLSRLLLRFGISTRTRSVTPTGTCQARHTLDICGTDDQRRFLQEIGVHGDPGDKAARLLEIIKASRTDRSTEAVPTQVWDDVRDLLTEKDESRLEPALLEPALLEPALLEPALLELAPSRQRLGKIAAVLEDEGLEILAVNDLMWDEIVAIEPLGDKQVFDATVLDTHNFIANGIAVHNSIEQDADMVILLHREDAYEKESPRAGEADLIVAKHRNGPTATVTVAFQGHYSRFVDMQVQA